LRDLVPTRAELENFGDASGLLAEAAAGAASAPRAVAAGRKTLKDLEASIAAGRSAGAAASSVSAAALMSARSQRGGGGHEHSDDDDRPAAVAGKKRGRGRAGGSDDESVGGGGDGSDEDDAFYAAAAEAARAKKKARKDEVAGRAASKREEETAYYRSMRDTDELEDGEGEGRRKATKKILDNRGLMKSRNRKDSNPRKHNRRRVEKAIIRRKGQVVPMRDAGEGVSYGGEATGVRSFVTHSRKINT